MKYSSLPWRRRAACPTYRRTYKMFNQLTDEEGVYFTQPTRKERDAMIQPPPEEDLFQMPNLILDLDAEQSNRVREYKKADEERLAREWRKSPKTRAVDKSIARLWKMLTHARYMDQKLRDDLTHPHHINRHDILSAALVGGPLSTERDPENDTTDKSTEARFIITELSREEFKDNDQPRQEAQPGEGALAQASQTISGLHLMAMLGNPRGRPDYMRQMLVGNGIPPHATQEDERLIRWMTVRSRIRRAEQSPSVRNITRAIRDLETKRISITTLRRILFNSGDDAIHQLSTGPAAYTAAVDIRNFCVRMLDAYPTQLRLYYEVLTLANNLAARVPDSEPFAACVFSLRMRALAELCLRGQSLELLSQGIESKIWERSSRMDLMADIGDALRSWRRHVVENPVMGRMDARRDLFCILTGFGGKDSLGAGSYRAFIQQKDTGSSQSRLAVYGQYVDLLGQLGAVRTLWGEWRTASTLMEELRGNSVPDDAESEIRSFTEVFRQATLDALHISGSPGAQAAGEWNLGECMSADFESLTDLPMDNPEIPRAGRKASMEEFSSVMDLPLSKAIERLRMIS